MQKYNFFFYKTKENKKNTRITIIKCLFFYFTPYFHQKSLEIDKNKNMQTFNYQHKAYKKQNNTRKTQIIHVIYSKN